MKFQLNFKIAATLFQFEVNKKAMNGGISTYRISTHTHMVLTRDSRNKNKATIFYVSDYASKFSFMQHLRGCSKDRDMLI